MLLVVSQSHPKTTTQFPQKNDNKKSVAIVAAVAATGCFQYVISLFLLLLLTRCNGHIPVCCFNKKKCNLNEQQLTNENCCEVRGNWWDRTYACKCLKISICTVLRKEIVFLLKEMPIMKFFFLAMLFDTGNFQVETISLDFVRSV